MALRRHSRETKENRMRNKKRGFQAPYRTASSRLLFPRADCFQVSLFYQAEPGPYVRILHAASEQATPYPMAYSRETSRPKTLDLTQSTRTRTRFRAIYGS